MSSAPKSVALVAVFFGWESNLEKRIGVTLAIMEIAKRNNATKLLGYSWKLRKMHLEMDV